MSSDISTLCKNYKTLKGDDRLWTGQTHITDVKCDVNLNGHFRFETSDKKPLQLKEGCNKQSFIQDLNKCGGSSFGWMTEAHPSITDGLVARLICFSHGISISTNTSSCESCSQRRIAWVQNCSGFYVYKLSGVVSCNSRYCTEFMPGKTLNSFQRLNLIIFIIVWLKHIVVLINIMQVCNSLRYCTLTYIARFQRNPQN